MSKTAAAHEHAKAAPVRAPKVRAEATYMDQLKELPGELRYRVAAQSRHPADLARIVNALQEAIDGIRADGSSEELRTASTRLAAGIEHAQRILTRLTMFSGELEGIAWIVQAREELEGRTSADEIV